MCCDRAFAIHFSITLRKCGTEDLPNSHTSCVKNVHHFTLLPARVADYSTVSVSVRLFVCLYVCAQAYPRSSPHFVHVTHGRGSVQIWFTIEGDVFELYKALKGSLVTF